MYHPAFARLTKEDILQAVLDDLGRGTYLEIGVRHGASFGGVSAAEKIGVDPRLSLSRRARLLVLMRQKVLRLRGQRLFEMTSDEFFGRVGSLVPRLGIDAALVDGLHTYAQSLRDVENVLQHLVPRGVVVLHDCNPTTAAMAHSASSLAQVVADRPPGWSGQWTGDVWKTIVHLRAFRTDLHVFTLDCDFGVGVVTRGRPESRLALTQVEIAGLGYADLDSRRGELLNLKPPEAFFAFRQAWRAGRL